ncbi:MAG TPA: hypothetical protein VN605_02725 [Thermoanaerobaculia bacterium]|nr:hypothetical protein [Thermoanaerobaculia bacterium]
MRTARADRVALLLLAGCAIAVFSDILFLGSGFYYRDVTMGFIPCAAIMRDALLHGEFPVWTRQLSAGQPLAANPAFQAFYPSSWLALLPRFPFGFQLEVVAHVVLAACGMYALLRRWMLSVQASLFGAIAFAFGGGFLSLTNVVSTMRPVAWWPLIVLFVGEYVRRGRRRDGALAALTLAMALLALEPSVVLETAILCAAVVFLLRAHLTPRRMAGLTLAVVAAFAIASVQLMPAIDLQRDSGRAGGLTYDDAMSWSMPLLRPFEVVFPDFLGSVGIDLAHFRGGMLYDPPRAPWLLSLYNGLLVAVLCLAGFALRMRGWLAAASLALISYLLAIGVHGPLVPLLYRAGILRSIRYPEKFAVLGLFVAIVFAATVFDRLVEERRVARAVLIATGCVALLAIAGALAPNPPRLSPHDLRFALGASVAGTAARRAWWIAIARLIVIAAVLVVLLRTRDRRALTLALLVTAIDLGVRIDDVAPRMPARYFEPPSIAAATADAGHDVRLFHEADFPGLPPEQQIRFPVDHDPFWSVRNAMMPLTSATWGLQSVLDADITGLNLAPTNEFARATWETAVLHLPAWPLPLLRMANAGYRIRADHSNRVDGVRVEEVATNPRYWFADQLVKVHSRQEFVRALGSRRWSRRVAFVGFAPFAPAPGTVISVDETRRAATLHIEADDRAFLVISVTPHRYWRAQLDGRDVQLMVANVGFQGIVVPKGAHELTMRYSNPVITACGLLAIFALAATIGAAVILTEPRDGRTSNYDGVT